jgi:hypothetical protein
VDSTAKPSKTDKSYIFLIRLISDWGRLSSPDFARTEKEVKVIWEHSLKVISDL